MTIEPESNPTIEPQPVDRAQRRARGRMIAGAILILVGLMTFLSQFVPTAGLLFLPGLAVIFLAWGLLARNIGLIIPGGILAGIGGGTLLMTGPFAAVPEPARGGVFLLCFAAGFVLITILAPFVLPNPRFVWWPLIPAFFMAFTGAALFIGPAGTTALQYLGYGWPVVLVALGLYMILRRRDM
ncbi:MAG TPA: hypothetical protein VHR86_06205 [Armatimonadota bacterium]|nr:hypothetical protein [Armatimonadota bacterium]